MISPTVEPLERPSNCVTAPHTSNHNRLSKSLFNRWRFLVVTAIVFFAASVERLQTLVVSSESRLSYFLGGIALLGFIGRLVIGAWDTTTGLVWFRSYVCAEKGLANFLYGPGSALCIALFAVPFLANLQFSPPGDFSAWAAFLGRIPLSDASGYLQGSRKLLEFGVLDGWNERRPLNATLLAVRLALTSLDIELATLLQCLLCGYCVYLLARSVAISNGIWSSLFLTSLCYAFARDWVSHLNSEALGFSLSCLSAVLLYNSVTTDFRGFWVGVTGFALATLCRPGPVFILPLLILSGTLYFTKARSQLLKTGLILSLAVLPAFAVNRAILAIYGTGNGAFQSNFAYVLLGLATNKGWKEAKDAHTNQLTNLSEREKASYLYSQALSEIRRRPELLLQTLATRSQEFVAQAPLYLRPSFGTSSEVSSVLVSITLALAALGILVPGRPGERQLLWHILIGIFLSAPIVWKDGKLRVFATAVPFFALAAARPLKAVTGADTPAILGQNRNASLLLLTLSSVAMFGPALSYSLIAEEMGAPNPKPLSTDPVVFRSTDLRSAVLVTDSPLSTAKSQYQISSIDVDAYSNRLRWAHPGDRELLSPKKAPFILVIAFDLQHKRKRHLIAPPGMLELKERFIWARTAAEGRQFFEVTRYGSVPHLTDVQTRISQNHTTSSPIVEN